MNILIVEDELLGAERLQALIKEIKPDAHIMAITQSIKKTVNWLLEHPKPDLILMDIELSDGQCFEIFRQFDLRVPVIFTTSYDEYTLQAFKVNSVDYLLKPITRQDLMSSFQKFERLHKPQMLNYDDLVKMLKSSEDTDYQKRFLVSSGTKIRSVETSEVSYFFAEGRYVTLVTKSGQKFIVDFTMEELENKLDPKEFYRINRQIIIAFRSIESMYSWSKSRLKLKIVPTPDFDVVVSVDRSPDFKKWLNR